MAPLNTDPSTRSDAPGSSAVALWLDDTQGEASSCSREGESVTAVASYLTPRDDPEADRTVRLSRIASHPGPAPRTSTAFAGTGRYSASSSTSLTQVRACSDSISPTSPDGHT